jgi:hypothetical protein
MRQYLSELDVRLKLKRLAAPLPPCCGGIFVPSSSSSSSSSSSGASRSDMGSSRGARLVGLQIVA